MKILSQRIKQARLAAGLNQSELARALVLTPQAVQKWETGEMLPKSGRLKKISKVLGVSQSWLLGESETAESGIADESFKVVMLDNSGSMGAGDADLNDDVIAGEIVLSKGFIDRLHPVKIATLRLIHAYGDSMSPTLNSGDILLVDTAAHEVKIDGIYVLRAHERLFVKRVRQRIDGHFEISSDNPTHKTVDILNGDNNVDVIGRVVYYWNGNKVV